MTGADVWRDVSWATLGRDRWIVDRTDSTGWRCVYDGPDQVQARYHADEWRARGEQVKVTFLAGQL